jgi:hypothetical protein
MKHPLIAVTAVAFLVTSCSIFKTKIRVNDAIAEKVKIENTTNPVRKQLILDDLKKKRIALDNVLVKSVTGSNNIDYDYCVITEVEVDGKKVEFYIYSKNLRLLSRLQEGVSRVDVVGDFKRFFSMLDEYYTKVEIVNSKLTLVKNNAEAAQGAVRTEQGE